MKIVDIIASWKEDTQKFDDLNLDQESARLINMHGKYIEWLSHERTILRSLYIEKKRMILKLREYFLGSATDEDLQEIGRTPNPIKILRNEANMYIESDPIMTTLDSKIAIQEEKVEYLNSIVKGITNRQFHIRDAIAWRKFLNGTA